MKSKHLEAARELAEQGRFDDAYRIADKFLREDPNSYEWLMVMCFIMLSTDKPVLAYSLAKRITQMVPKEPGGWLNLGTACRDIWREKEAVRVIKRGLKVCKNNEQQASLCVNLSSVLIDTGEFKEAEKYCRQAIEANPDTVKGKANLGFCLLAQRKWREGWELYRHVLGHEWRPITQYGGEPLWDGKGKGSIVLYAEQGLGDVISFGSMVPDIAKWAKENDSKIILDVNASLEGLFRRSFPDVKTYGTRQAKKIVWDKEDCEINYSLPIGQAAEYFRNKDSDFPGTPYLKPDPDRVLQWKALFESKKKPVIGLAWSGGIPKTGAKFRRVDLEQLLPVLESVDAHWVSLQYKPAGKEIAAFKEKHPHIDLVEYPHGTLTKDYDDTVAMVAAMDQVVAMHTSVVHVAGGLGVPCWTFVPMNSQWRYGQGYEDFLWAKSLKLIRQTKRGEWLDVIKQTAEDLHARFPRIQKTAGKTPRKRKLRSNGAQVRRNDLPDSRQAGA